MRAFVAVEVPEPARSALADLVARLEGTHEPVKWVKGAGPALFHVTIKFLGEVPTERVAAVEAALAGAAAGVAPFSLSLRGLGVYPNARRPRVVFSGVEAGAEPLASLAAACETGLEPLGFTREARPFSAHVTLGRVKEAHARRRPRPNRAPEPGPGPGLATALAAEQAFAAGPVPVAHLTLFESKLQRTGAVYSVVREIRLGEAGAEST